MEENRELDMLLSLRRDVAVPEGLAERIINSAAVRRPARVPLWQNLLWEFQAMFVLPRPAYALVAAAVFGLWIGMGTAPLPEVQSDWTSFLTVDTDMGGWL